MDIESRQRRPQGVSIGDELVSTKVAGTVSSLCLGSGKGVGASRFVGSASIEKLINVRSLQGFGKSPPRLHIR